MIEILKAIKNELKTLKIPYSFDNWGKEVELPYFVGELNEIQTLDEDGKREFLFTLTGEDVDTYTKLYKYTEILRKTYKQSKKVSLSNGAMVISYNRTINVPVDSERVKRTQTEFTIYMWETE